MSEASEARPRSRASRPLDFIARLAALVPKPRVNLTRSHGVFASNSKHRVLVTRPQAVAKRSER
ncbi:putative transposase [Nitrococcus mobilis Nb-231]|uniref:Putative transposase n=1 Tax=Nitrococcus mobilis Nb-231 TaxID=314278 RepID=A4BN91_9GAMM|nr:transposase [Nitrococcus mobilis]EAR22690.1 putative transposase [Nitrococcus mobilis Nb-231]